MLGDEADTDEIPIPTAVCIKRKLVYNENKRINRLEETIQFPSFKSQSPMSH